MGDSMLEKLKNHSVVVADTGDIASIRQFKPQDATTNPTLITQAAQMPEYEKLIQAALAWARERSPANRMIAKALDRLAVVFGLEILKIVPGRVSTEVDARLSYDTNATITKARDLIAQYEEAGVSRGRILIKIAATWEGIEAARVLEREGIHCNMTLIFGIHQAVACANAGAQLISPFVGRILDWHKADSGRDSYAAEEDPGVLSVRDIYHYYKHFGHRTEVMAASFRNADEIIALAGCDLLTIAPKFLAELKNRHDNLPRKLDPEWARTTPREELSFTQAEFAAAHAQSRVSTDLLKRGIEQFVEAIIKLENILTEA